MGFKMIYIEWVKKVDFCDFWDPKMYCSKDDPSKGNFMRGIDCAHFRTLKIDFLFIVIYLYVLYKFKNNCLAIIFVPVGTTTRSKFIMSHSVTAIVQWSDALPRNSVLHALARIRFPLRPKDFACSIQRENLRGTFQFQRGTSDRSGITTCLQKFIAQFHASLRDCVPFGFIPLMYHTFQLFQGVNVLQKNLNVCEDVCPDDLGNYKFKPQLPLQKLLGKMIEDD